MFYAASTRRLGLTVLKYGVTLVLALCPVKPDFASPHNAWSRALLPFLCCACGSCVFKSFPREIIRLLRTVDVLATVATCPAHAPFIKCFVLQPATSVIRCSVLHPIAHLDHDLFEIEFIYEAPPSLLLSKSPLFAGRELSTFLHRTVAARRNGLREQHGRSRNLPCVPLASRVTRLDRLSIYPSPISPLSPSPSPANLIVFGLNLVVFLGGLGGGDRQCFSFAGHLLRLFLAGEKRERDPREGWKWHNSAARCTFITRYGLRLSFYPKYGNLPE